MTRVLGVEWPFPWQGLGKQFSLDEVSLSSVGSEARQSQKSLDHKVKVLTQAPPPGCPVSRATIVYVCSARVCMQVPAATGSISGAPCGAGQDKQEAFLVPAEP